MGWGVCYDVSILFKDKNDKKIVEKLLDCTWLDGMVIDNGKELLIDESDYDSHFDSDYQEALVFIERFVENANIYLHDDEMCFWKIELNKDTDYKWVVRNGDVIYEPISKASKITIEEEKETLAFEKALENWEVKDVSD